MAGLTHPLDMTVVSCQQSWGEGGGGTPPPTPTLMTAAELHSKVTKQKFRVAEIALLMHCTSATGMWEWNLVSGEDR